MLHTIMECEYMYYLRYVKRVVLKETSPSLYGTAIHRAIKNGYDGNLAREDWAKAFKREWMSLTSNKDVVLNGEGEYLKKFKDGQQMLLDYYDKFVKRHKPPQSTELFFGRDQGITLGKHVLIGVIDQIDSKDRIIDYKSGAKPTSQRLDMDLQFTIYSYVYRQMFGKPEGALLLRHLGTMKDMSTTREESDYALLLGEVDKIEAKLSVKNPVYVRNLDRGCADCYFIEQCLGKERRIGRFAYSSK